MAPTILTPAVWVLGDRAPVALANLSSARHKQSEDFGGQSIVGIAVACSTLELMVHTGLRRLLGGSYARDVVRPVPRRAPRGTPPGPFWRFCRCLGVRIKISARALKP